MMTSACRREHASDVRPDAGANAVAAQPAPSPSIEEPRDADRPATASDADASVDDVPDESCVSGPLAGRVRVGISPETDLALRWMDVMKTRVIGGTIAVTITNLTTDRLCVRHYDSFSVRLVERRSGRQEYLRHVCQCASLAAGSRGTRMVLAPGETRLWEGHSVNFSCTPIALPAGDYDLRFSVLPGEHRVPLPHLEAEITHAAVQRCDALLRSKAFWSAAVSSEPFRLLLRAEKP